jgi:hypothetical protein
MAILKEGKGSTGQRLPIGILVALGALLWLRWRQGGAPGLALGQGAWEAKMAWLQQRAQEATNRAARVRQAAQSATSWAATVRQGAAQATPTQAAVLEQVASQADDHAGMLGVAADQAVAAAGSLNQLAEALRVEQPPAPAVPAGLTPQQQQTWLAYPQWRPFLLRLWAVQ